MIQPIKTLTLSFAFTLLSASVALASGLPEGSFKGSSTMIQNRGLQNDAMAFLIKKDPNNAGRSYAVLAEYDRLPLTNVTTKTAITKWVNRMYAYQIDQVGELQFQLKPLKVAEDGSIVGNEDVPSSMLLLANKGTLEKAVLVRVDIKTGQQVEAIAMKGRVGSTWEKMVPGNYFGTSERTGNDYFNKDVNTYVTNEGLVLFNQKDIQGRFQLVEGAPGLFSMQSLSEDNQGLERVAGRIAVFIDIVNWKPLFTTDEMLLINPENAEDVGFYYERH